jgi:endogenous inhibitor of DNA gyrase (YacG/DUF329 family)
MSDPVSGETPAPEKPVRPCAICGKPAVEAYKPFCSKRCANVDLNRWLGGHYAIEGRPLDEDEAQGLLGQRAGDDEGE